MQEKLNFISAEILRINGYVSKLDPLSPYLNKILNFEKVKLDYLYSEFLEIKKLMEFESKGLHLVKSSSSK